MGHVGYYRYTTIKKVAQIGQDQIKHRNSMHAFKALGLPAWSSSRASSSFIIHEARQSAILVLDTDFIARPWRRERSLAALISL